MASDIDHKAIRLPPTEQPPAAEYWGDFYSWLMEQAAHVRARAGDMMHISLCH
jgi:hypothetical protein